MNITSDMHSTIVEDLRIRLGTVIEELKQIYDMLPNQVDHSIQCFNSTDYDTSFEMFKIRDVVSNVLRGQQNLFALMQSTLKKKTQDTSNICEDFVYDKLVTQGFLPYTLSTQKKCKTQDSKFKGKTARQIIAILLNNQTYQIDLAHTGDLFNDLEEGKHYIVKQPCGSQKPPDVLLLTRKNETLYLFALEVKTGDAYPTWNNNPPKAGFGYVFVCRNDQKMYYASGKDVRGLEIITDDVVKKCHALFCNHLEKYVYGPSSNTKVISYKKIECTMFPKFRLDADTLD
jgi:hypothetical protein